MHAFYRAVDQVPVRVAGKLVGGAGVDQVPAGGGEGPDPQRGGSLGDHRDPVAVQGNAAVVGEPQLRGQLDGAGVRVGVLAGAEELDPATAGLLAGVAAAAPVSLAQGQQVHLAVPARAGQSLHALVLFFEGEVEPRLGAAPEVAVEFLDPGLEPVAAADGFHQQVKVTGGRVPGDIS